MAKRKSKRGSRARRRRSTSESRPASVAGSPRDESKDLELLRDLEVHRGGVGLISRSSGGRTHWSTALGVFDARSRVLRSCSCAAQGTCDHLKTLMRAIEALKRRSAGSSWEQHFSGTLLYRLAWTLHDHMPLVCRGVGIETVACELEGAGGCARRLRTADGRVLLDFFDVASCSLFEERLGLLEEASDRAQLLQRLAIAQQSELEAALRRRGGQTQKRAWEESFWHRFAYHVVRCFEPEELSCRPHFAGAHDLRLLFASGESPLFELCVPAARAHAVAELLAEHTQGPLRIDLALHPIALEEVQRLRRLDRDTFELADAIRVRLESGATQLIDSAVVAAHRAGRLLLLEELGRFATLPQPASASAGATDGAAGTSRRLGGDEVPAFLERHRDAIAEGGIVLDAETRKLQVFHAPDAVELAPSVRDRSWYWMSVRYRYGPESLDLPTLLRARDAKQRYLATRGGWVDLSSNTLRLTFAVTDSPQGVREGGEQRWRARDLLRLGAASRAPITIEGQGEARLALERLLEAEPRQGFKQPSTLVTPLRDYQRRGAEWLLFLYDNGLGGLLCDDMGLGKTHQVMALMATLALREEVDKPMLVVCPTTVISHWRNKLREHAPSLEVLVHHGAQRTPLERTAPRSVVLTSYGILRRDLEQLRELRFELVVFDEIQHLKNRQTQAYEAARQIPSELCLGLTGTPIENAVEELYALFDLVLPGYLGAPSEFRQRCLEGQPARERPAPNGAASLDDLRSAISPFVLRRLKASVLQELPEKIEDVRTCTLSELQAEQYRTVLAQRAGRLVESLEDEEERVQTLHVFAVLNLLKRVCDHPALLLDDLDNAERYPSGKFELFSELLQECLDSGLKVVVFTQYLGMLRLMSRHLERLGVGHVGLSGATRQRGEVIERFNRDPSCRVFLGSLKAGGTGIDLIGGSVVIHYDQWWNAAREDQATDRVHRFGQRRAVQVFRLITEGTLEEKIAAIVDEKRRLMDAVVTEDDPSLSKLFTRQQLIELLQPAVASP